MPPRLEGLEDRLAPSVTTINVNDNADKLDNPTNVTAATLGGNVTLRDAINAANNSGGGNTYQINLQANTTYDLTTIDNYWYGPDGLPGVFSNITINGSGATIQRDSSAANFRLFYVSGGLDGPPPGSLTLENLTLQGGVAQGGGSHAGGGGLGAGGAIFSQGTLTLTGVTVSNNQAVGGSSGAGGNSSGGGGMGQNAASTTGGGFGGSLNVPTGYTGSIGGGGGTSGSSSGGGGGGFGTGDSGANGSGFNGGAGGGKGSFGGRGGNYPSATYSGDGGGGAYGTGLGYPGYNGGRFGAGAAGSTSASGGGGGGIGGGGGGGLFCAGGGGGGFGGGGGDGGYVNGGGGGFGAGGGGSFYGQTARGGFGGGNGAAGSYFTSTGGGGGGMGGAIFNMMGSLTITNSTLSGNAARGGSGANGGSGYGGAIFNLDGTLNITFGTLAGNTVAGSSSDGGAVYNLAYGNNPTTGGAQSATATIFDSILSNSIGGNDLANNVVNGANNNTATATLNGPNLVMSSSGAITGTPTVTADPQLGTLQNNAGPTPTLAVTANSPAYQAGVAVSGITTDQRGATRYNPPTLGAFEVQPATVITTSDVTTGFSSNPQSLTLNADVTSGAGTVNESTVTFTILQGKTVIGSATTSGTVSNGLASVNYILPANTAVGVYTIDAVFNNSLHFSSSFDDSHTLTVNPANVTNVAGNATAYFSPNQQGVTLTANLTDDSISSDTVNEGIVTFTVMNGVKKLGSVQGAVSAGVASAILNLPPGQGVGTYTIDVAYSDSSGDFIDIGDTNAKLTLAPANLATTASNVSTVYSPSTQTVTFNASIVDQSHPFDTVAEGSVTFTVMQGGAKIGSVVANVNNSAASTSFTVPAGLAAGNYTIDVAYSDSKGNYTDNGDTSAPLIIAAAKATTAAVNGSTAFRPGTQDVTLTANVASTAGTVNEGAVTFTVMQGKTVIGTATTSGTVSNGQASVSYALPPGQAAGNYTVAVTYGDANGNFFDSGDNNATLTINPAKAITTAIAAAANYSPNSQSVSLNATLADGSFSTDAIGEGTVTFTVYNGVTPLGSVSNTVSGVSTGGGTANAAFTLPGGLAVGSYSIGVSYSDSAGNYTDYNDVSANLIVSPAGVTVTAATPPSVAFSSSPQNMTLSATVADTTNSSDIVNEGSVVFTVLKNGSAIQTVAGAVNNGTASVNFTLPPGATAGIYTIAVAYTDSPGDFSDQSDTNAFLVVANAGAVVTANNVSTTYSPKSQAVMLSASVANSSDAADTIDEGVVKFTILNGSTPLGSVQSGVINGSASAGFLLPAGQARGSYTIAVSYSDSSGNFGDSSNQSGTLTISPVTVATTATSVSTFYSPNNQTVALSAKVANLSFPSDTIGDGSVTFTITGSGKTLGSVSGAVSGGTANANFALLGGQAVGNYSIQVVYSDSSGNNTDGGDQNATLTVAPAHVATTADKLSTVYSGKAQTLALSAAVADASVPSDTVNEGTVTFTVSSGNTPLGSVPATVSGGAASANFNLAPGQAAGSYTVAVSYADSQGNFRDSGDTSAVLTVSPANVATTADSASAVYSNNRQIIQISASVANASNPSDTVNEGVVSFAIQSGGTTVASSLGKVSGGTVTTNIALPAGLAPGSYTIAVGYSDVFGNFQDSGDQSANLMVATSNVTATAAAATAVYSTSAQTVTLNANVVDASVPSDIVNEGTVVFTVTNGGTVVGSTPGTVSGGKASAPITLPAGLAAGNYGLSVRYSDGPGKLVDIGDSNAVLSVGPAGVTVAAAAANATFSTTPQTLTLSAAVGSGVVGEGDVFFTVLNGNTAVASAVGAVNGGTANATVSLPGGLAAGNYGLAVRYLDGQGNLVETGNSNAVISIGAASTTVSLTQVSLTPDYGSLTDTETLTAHVSGSTAVTEGTVTFYLSNTAVTANVDGNGNAVAVVTLPMLDLLSPQSISVGYSDAAGNLTGSSNAQSAQWQFINALLPSTATFSPNSETVTADMFGLFITYTDGRLTEIDYGSIEFIV